MAGAEKNNKIQAVGFRASNLSGGLNQNRLSVSKNPAACVTIIRYEIDKKNMVDEDKRDIDSAYKTIPPIFIKSGIIKLDVAYSKNSPFHTFDLQIIPTEYNLLSDVMPGDYVLINIVNDKSKIEKIEQNVLNLKPINLEEYGFKGIFKIESIRQIYQVVPENGAKLIIYNIAGYAFKEFNSVIYYNPFLVFSNEKNDYIVYMSRLANEFSEYLVQNKLDSIKNDFLIQFLWNAFLGQNKAIKTDKKMPDTPNETFVIPKEVCLLMNIQTKSEKAQAKNLYRLITGIQKYPNSYEPEITSPNLAVTVFTPQFWDQVPIWNILKGFENAPVDEMFSLFRKDKNGYIYPYVFYRQIPYSTKKLDEKIKATYFHELPVWRIHPSLVLSYNIGREDSHRFNYVSVFSIAPSADPETNNTALNYQVASGNFKKNSVDIMRHGLRASIIVTRHDDFLKNKKELYAKDFTEILSDVMLNAHLKLNGVLTCFGVEEAITIGDNLALSGILFHIESIHHSFSVQPESGHTSFITNISLSNGVSVEQSDFKFGLVHDTSLQSNKENNDPSLPVVDFTPIKEEIFNKTKNNKEKNKKEIIKKIIPKKKK